MKGHIVSDSAGITLLGGGSVRPEDLTEALTYAPKLVAVDGGAGVAVAQRLIPAAVVGDMDSIPETARAALPPDRLHLIAEQDSIDFDKAMRSVSAPLVLGVGFLGRRVDHQLANFNVLVRRAREHPTILIGKHDIVFAAPPHVALNLAAGSRVSLFPLAPATGFSEGLHWPIDGIAMSPDGATGTSNKVEDGWSQPVVLAFDSPGMLVILPRKALGAAIAALASAASGPG